MPGYANQYIHLQFPQLSEDYDTDPIWVAIRNPMLQPIDRIRPADVELGPDGKPLNPDDAVNSMYSTIAGLVIAWRVYDAGALDVDMDDQGNPVFADAVLMPAVNRQHPATPAMIKQLPMEIVNTIAGKLKQGVNPQ